SNSDSNNVSILRNSGIGIFFAAKTFPVGGNPEAPQLLAGDLDADGDVDVVAFDTDDNDVSVLLNGSSFCQQNLGSGGPGHSVLTACGDPLATGGTGFIQLANAAPNTTAFLVVSLTQGAAPFKGGTLVPVPILLLRTFTTDAAGGFLLPGVPGGGGPLNLYLQCASADGSQPQGFALSNAVKLKLLP
ncbi:MAG TPA: VCBS repeat-containing protein, partial [Planctomycetota bacterium]|nr:VCBS repeat-containing protein [Planctomycetota bacterium]